MNIKDILERDNIRDILMENISCKNDKIDVELDFSGGELKGNFIIYTVTGYVVYGKTIWVDNEGLCRVNAYYTESPDGKGSKNMGEIRFDVSSIKKVVIKGKEW